MASPRIFQYLIKVQPLVTPTVPPLDWDVQDPVAPRLLPRPEGVQAVAPFQPGTDVIRLDWQPTTPIPTRAALRPFSEGVLPPIQPAAVTLDWVVQHPLAPVASRPPQTESVLAPFQPAAVTTDWLIEHPLPPRAVPPVPQGATIPLPPPPIDLGWQSSFPDRLDVRLRPPTLAWAAPYWVPDVTTPAPTLSWQGYQPAQIWPRVAPFPPAEQQAFAASPTMFQSIPPVAILSGQVSVDYPEMPTNMGTWASLGG